MKKYDTFVLDILKKINKDFDLGLSDEELLNKSPIYKENIEVRKKDSREIASTPEIPVRAAKAKERKAEVLNKLFQVESFHYISRPFKFNMDAEEVSFYVGVVEVTMSFDEAISFLDTYLTLQRR